MPRVLVLCEYPTLLGGERSLLAALPAIVAAGYEVHVAAPGAGPLADLLREREIPHQHWQTQDAAGVRPPLPALRESLAAIIRRVQPDIVHANSLATARISGPVAAECGVPGIGHLRDIVKLAGQAMNDLNANRQLIAVSHATREFHVAQGLDATKCVVVNNGVDLKQFCPREPTGYLHRELNLPHGARLVATIGQLGLRKGADVALAAAKLVAERSPEIHWLVVGERTSSKDESREFEQNLHAAAASEPLTSRVHFLGSRRDVPELLSECVMLAHAARQEPLGRVLLEAAASGTAVVATDVGGTREIFPDEAGAAILVRAEDAIALADAQSMLLSDEARRRWLAANARRRAEVAFDIRQASLRLLEQYQSVLI